ncbi:DUF6805 domain-containing protein [Neobacillus drentensis]|uniref:DUF6805 domain-containing protein n=1 Tax=Neobacillus drentensis TaxID=220684 RepID=UPI002FFE52F3
MSRERLFCYVMKVEPDKQMYLQVTYYGRDKTIYMDGKKFDRNFDILIDGTVIAHQKLEGKLSESLIDICYEIPVALTDGKEKVEVKFSSSEGKAAGYGIRIIN